MRYFISPHVACLPLLELVINLCGSHKLWNGYTNNLNALPPFALGVKISSLVYQRIARQWALCGFFKPETSNLS